MEDLPSEAQTHVVLVEEPRSRGTLLSSERLAAIHFVEKSQIDQRSEEKYRNGNSTTKHPDPYDVEE
eukprot:scaffold5015_cov160-Skeletonema_dohrnii-CCMP3373.AAC.1